MNAEDLMATLYRDALAAGLMVDHHESDLYIIDTPAARALCRKHNHKCKPFKGSDGGRWLDVPFAYDPFWESRSNSGKRGHSTKSKPYRLGEYTVTDSDAMRMERATGRTSEPFHLNPTYYGVRIVASERAGYTPGKYVVQYKDKNGMWFDIGDPKTKAEAQARKRSAAKQVVRR